MRISITVRKGLRAWSVLFWLALWQLGSMALTALYPHGHLLLASPVRVLLRLWSLLPDASFWGTAARSARGILGGFLLSCLMAIPLGALAAGHSRLRELLAPLVAVVKTAPVASFIILALVWLNPRTLPCFISALMVFPTVYLNVLEGVGQMDCRLLEMALVFRVPFHRRLWGVYLPQVLPYFRSAASLALGLCWKAGAAAEVIALSGGTIGERLYNAKIYLQTPDLFAWTVVIIAVSAGFEHLFLKGLDALEHLLCSGRMLTGKPPACRDVSAEIKVTKLRKSYGKRPVLDLSFSAGPGITCVTAPSGTGKTTLLRLLMGLEEPDSGTISGSHTWTAVFQEDRLLEDLNAAGNLRFVLGDCLEGAAELLSRLGLDLLDPRPVRAWSGGMKRRLALARALLSPGEALALDEPFTGLDEALRGICLECVKSSGRLALLVTHDPRDACGLPVLRLPVLGDSDETSSSSP